MKHLLQLLLFGLLLTTCSPTKQIEKRYTPDDKLVFNLMERLNKRALEQSNRNLINNSSNINPPSRNELAQRLIDNCYNQLLSRIKNGVSFDY